MPILLERPGRHPGQLVGRSPYLQAVHVEARNHAAIGDLVEVRIDAARPHSLAGTIVRAGHLPEEIAA
jgi:tRNA-2-methylthio-N6-dimethylallyladenosine synthase